MLNDAVDLAKRTVSDRILKDRAFEIAINPKYDGYQRGLAFMVYNFSDKKLEPGINVNEVLAQEFHKPVIKNFLKRKVYARFKVNIWTADLAEIGTLSSKNRCVKYSLCAVNDFIKCG